MLLVKLIEPPCTERYARWCERSGNHSDFPPTRSNRFGGLLNPQAINRTIRRILENYNAEEVLNAKREERQPIIIPHFSCHHLRHTFCTRFCENETNVKIIQAVMGHANIETTLDIYAEVTDMKKTEAIESLSRNLHIF